MKIYGTSCFEKLKVRSVNINDNNVLYSFMCRKLSDKEFESFDIDNMENGWITVTDINKSYTWMTAASCFYIWMKIDHDHYIKFFSTYSYDGDALIGGNLINVTNSHLGLMYLYIDRYKNTFPKHSNDSRWDIKAVFETNININKFNSQDDIKLFYKEYDVCDKIYNLYKNENI